MRYHLAYDANDFSLYRWEKPSSPDADDGCYRCLENSKLAELPQGEYKLEYLYHNVGYCSIITKLFANGFIILDAEVDRVELEWIVE